MRSCLVLSKLRRLSPLFNLLVKRALKENIRIISLEDYLKICLRYHSIPNEDRLIVMGAGHFPKMGLSRIIVVSVPRVLSQVAEGNLGIYEIDFTHEIGHNLSWSKKPKCSSDLCSPYPNCIDCAYFEALAYHLALQLLEQFRKELPDWRLVFHGKNMRALEIFQHCGLPRCYLEKVKGCRGLELHGLKRCPKKKELEKLVRAIEQSKI